MVLLVLQREVSHMSHTVGVEEDWKYHRPDKVSCSVVISNGNSETDRHRENRTIFDTCYSKDTRPISL